MLIDPFFEHDLQLCFELVISESDRLRSVLFSLVAALVVLTLTAVIASFALGVSSVSIVASVALAIGGVRHHGTLLLHVDALAISPVIATVVSLVIVTVTTATATTSATSTISIIVSIVLLLTCFCSLCLFQHFLLDLLLGLDILVALFELFPAELLVLKHVLDQLLNTFSDNASIRSRSLRNLPDISEILQDRLVFFITEFALGLISFATFLQFFLNSRSDFFNKFDCSFDCIIHEIFRTEEVSKDRLCRVNSQYMAHEQLANELNVAEKLVLSFKHLLLMVILRVCLASFLGLSDQLFEIVLLEDFFETISTVIEQLLAECAEFKHTWDGLFALGLEVDLDNGGTELAVEFGVSVLDLRLSEDSLHYSV